MYKINSFYLLDIGTCWEEVVFIGMFFRVSSSEVFDFLKLKMLNIFIINVGINVETVKWIQ